MGTRYFGKDFSDFKDMETAPIEELGRSVESSFIKRELKKAGWGDGEAIAATNELEKNLDKFIERQPLQIRGLNKEVLLSIILDIVKFERAFSEKEKIKQRRDKKLFSQNIGRKLLNQKNNDAGFKVELLDTLMSMENEINSSHRSPFKRQDALIIAAKWLAIINTKGSGFRKKSSKLTKLDAYLQSWDSGPRGVVASRIAQSLKRTWLNRRSLNKQP